MNNKYRIFIPTRDGASWLVSFLGAYRKLEIEPFYIVDERTNDNTIQLLIAQNAEFLLYTPKADYPESGMIEFAINNIRNDWLLRMDDDELPSASLVNWLQCSQNFKGISAWMISRREVSYINEKYVYSNWPTRRQFNKNEYVFNPQLRLFRKSKIKIIENVHTPGIIATEKIGIAPNNIFFIHCNNILRSSNERLEKIRKYASYDKELSWKIIDESLPEITSFEVHNYRSIGLDEFKNIFEEIGVKTSKESLNITSLELGIANSEVNKWIADVLVIYQQSYLNILQLHKESRRISSIILLFLPVFIITLVAEAVSTIARATSSAVLENISNYLWRLKSIKDIN